MPISRLALGVLTLELATLALGQDGTAPAGLHRPDRQLLKLVVVASTEDLVDHLPEVVAAGRGAGRLSRPARQADRVRPGDL